MKSETTQFIKRSVGKLNILYAFLIATSALQAIFMVIFALSTKTLINCAITADPILKTILINGILTVLWAIIAYVFLISSKILSEKCKLQAEVNIKNHCFKSILKKDYSKISAYKSGDVINRIINDSTIVARGYATVVPTIVSMSTKVVLIIGVLLIEQPLFTLFLVLFGAIILAVSSVIRKYFKKLHKATRVADSDVFSYYNESVNNLLAVKVFSSEDKVAQKGESTIGKYEKAAKKQRYASASLNTMMSFVFVMLYVATIIWGAIGFYLGLDGVDFGTITAFIQLISQIQAPFVNFTSLFSIRYEMIASAERIIELENLCDEITNNQIDIDALNCEIKSIKCKDLCFSYGREDVLKSVNFEISKGDCVLVKGVSGIGKSTLLKLLLGVYSPNSGSLNFELKNKKIAIASDTRVLFAYVPQRNLLFSGSIRENITFLNEKASEQEIALALKISCVNFLEELPNGIDTVIGENGLGLSEGQGQRIAIARAILCNKPFLLLDEATSALDEQTEEEILKNLQTYYKNKVTCILISHKQTSAKICNKTLLMTDGKVVAK